MYLINAIPCYSPMSHTREVKTTLSVLITQGCVTVNGVRVQDPQYMVQPGDEVQLLVTFQIEED